LIGQGAVGALDDPLEEEGVGQAGDRVGDLRDGVEEIEAMVGRGCPRRTGILTGTMVLFQDPPFLFLRIVTAA